MEYCSVPVSWSWTVDPVSGVADDVPGQSPIGEVATPYAHNIWLPHLAPGPLDALRSIKPSSQVAARTTGARSMVRLVKDRRRASCRSPAPARMAATAQPSSGSTGALHTGHGELRVRSRGLGLRSRAAEAVGHLHARDTRSGDRYGQQQANGFRGEDDPGLDRVVPAHPESVTGKALRTMRHRRWNRPVRGDRR